MAVRDPVTDDAVAVLDVSTWRHNLPAQAAGWLSNAVSGVRAILRQRARDSGAELAAAFAQASARSGQALAALDASGKVVIADEEASLLLGVPARVPALDPTVRWRPALDLGRLTRHATKQARLDHGWIGSTQIATGLSRRAPAAHAAPGVPRRPAHRGACRLRIRERGSRRDRARPSAG